MDWFEDLAPMGLSMRDELMHPIRIEEITKNDEMIIRAELPGVDPEKDIDVTIDAGYLTIKGERREEFKDANRSEFHYGSFTRSIALPSGVDDKSIHATYRDGILEVKVNCPPSLSTTKHVTVNRIK